MTGNAIGWLLLAGALLVAGVGRARAEHPPAAVDPLELEALGRGVASEKDTGTLAEMRGIAWAIRTRALERARTRYPSESRPIYRMLYPWRRQLGEDPPFSSLREATARTLAVARQVLAGELADPTRGANEFFEPDEQDRLFAAGVAGYHQPVAALRAAWLARGAQRVAIIGRFEFFRDREVA